MSCIYVPLYFSIWTAPGVLNYQDNISVCLTGRCGFPFLQEALKIPDLALYHAAHLRGLWYQFTNTWYLDTFCSIAPDVWLFSGNAYFCLRHLIWYGKHGILVQS